MKPLYRLSERETAAFAFLRKIDYIVEECPFAEGATSIAHKETLNRMEDASPGAKHNFLFGFLEKARAGLRAGRDGDAQRVRALRSGDHRHAVRILQARRPGEALGLSGEDESDGRISVPQVRQGRDGAEGVLRSPDEAVLSAA